MDLISRKEAIYAVMAGSLSAATVFGRTEHGMTALEETIRAIKELPSAHPEERTEERTETHACDLISRQAAIDAMASWDWQELYLPIHFKELLEELPSAQPEIIMCKDCKHVGTDATCCLVCTRDGMGLKPYHVYHDDFCSYAERRTDG